MNTDKMNVSAIFEMFETIKKKLEAAKPQMDINIQSYIQSVRAMTERLETLTEEIRNGKPAKVEHRHTIDIGSNKIFISLIGMFLMIMGMFFAVYEQRKTISQYKDSDLKYRYIKMQGQTDEENIYRLERQFKYNDSIKIIRWQVEKYEELVKEQAERIERAKRENKETERLQKEVEALRNQK